MEEVIKEMLALVGIITIICCLFGVIAILYYWASSLITIKKREYKIKHRFDKVPTAKCYCVDCGHWIKKDGGYCRYFDRETADCFFCNKADPNA